MGMFNRNNYDYGYRTGGYRGNDRDLGYGGAGHGYNREGYNREGWNRGGYGATGYDRNYYGYGNDRGYARDYKSRWETDYGDPFGDRTSRTPIRMMNEEFHGGGYDRDYNAGMRNRYDREYRGGNYSTGVGNDPYYGTGDTRGNMGYGNRGGYNAGYRGWGYNEDRGYGNNRGYDSGWF